MGTIAIFAFLPSANSDPPPGGNNGIIQDAEVAMSIRDAIGFGPADVLPAASDETLHQQMIGEGLGFVADSGTDLRTVVAAHQIAQEGVVRALTWGQDPTSAYAQLDAADTDRLLVAVDLLPTMEDIVVGQSEGDLVNTVVDNFGLDADLRPLDLTADQRQAILNAQRTRDAVLAQRHELEPGKQAPGSRRGLRANPGRNPDGGPVSPVGLHPPPLGR